MEKKTMKNIRNPISHFVPFLRYITTREIIANNDSEENTITFPVLLVVVLVGT